MSWSKNKPTAYYVMLDIKTTIIILITSLRQCAIRKSNLYEFCTGYVGEKKAAM